MYNRLGGNSTKVTWDEHGFDLTAVEKLRALKKTESVEMNVVQLMLPSASASSASSASKRNARAETSEASSSSSSSSSSSWTTASTSLTNFSVVSSGGSTLGDDTKKTGGTKKRKIGSI